MIGILLITHGRLGVEMIGAVEHIVGSQNKLDAVCIADDDDLEKKRAEIIEKVSALDSGCGVCIATDMFGGTPSNLAISVMNDRKIEVIAGLNLPMLIKLVRSRDLPLKQLVEQATEAGRKYINVASDLLKSNVS